MTLTVIFIISGLGIMTVITAKGLELRRQKSFFITNAISRGDIHARKIYHQIVHWYSEGKERTFFFLSRRLPIHSRNILNKLVSFLADKRRRYINNMRDSRLLKKSDGISEFFKNMSKVEKGNGEIHDDYKDNFQADKKELD